MPKVTHDHIDRDRFLFPDSLIHDCPNPKESVSVHEGEIYIHPCTRFFHVFSKSSFLVLRISRHLLNPCVVLSPVDT